MILNIALPDDDDLARWLATAARENFRSPEQHALWIISNARARAFYHARPLRQRVRAEDAQVLLDALRELYRRAGSPSTRMLAARITQAGVAVSHSTVHDALSGKRAVSWHRTEALVEALGGDVEAFRALWMTARTSA